MNDWIVANINNPDFETYDFVNIANMNAENSDSIGNFEKIINKLPVVAKSENLDLNKDFSRKKSWKVLYLLPHFSPTRTFFD